MLLVDFTLVYFMAIFLRLISYLFETVFDLISQYKGDLFLIGNQIKWRYGL